MELSKPASMEDAGPPSVLLTDLDLIDDFLLSGWVETSDYPDLFATSSPANPFTSSSFSPLTEISNSSEKEAEGLFLSPNPDQNDLQISSYDAKESLFSLSSSSSELRIQPKLPFFTERLAHVLDCIRQSQTCGNILVQIWVPVKIGERCFLSTSDQPFSIDHSCQNLVQYRTASTSYRFSAEENSTEAVGLPGRVFIGRVPEWTPDVRYFASHEFPRVNHAQRCDVRGTIALPVFERNSSICLGIVEVVSTANKINYRSDVESICSALQAVNLRSSDVHSIPLVKVKDDTYKAALPEILEVLRAVCEKHRLPLAQTWISCVQQGKQGSRHSENNYKDCLSTADEACYVNDSSLLGFYEACSEYHLFRGQGVAGKAFTTNQPCFSPDITAFSKIEYPLSHHAKLFDLQAAVAIRLRSTRTGIVDFVLEFFLPVSCREHEEQRLLLNSLSITIEQVCQSLRVVSTKELYEANSFPVSKAVHYCDSDAPSVGAPMAGFLEAKPSWSARVTEANRKEASSSLPACVPLGFNRQKSEESRFLRQQHHTEVMVPTEKLFSKARQCYQVLTKDVDDQKNTLPNESSALVFGKAAEKKQKKSEKTVSLQVLQQYFAGSLKDAAKNIGVCPTSLKRICRQHGITRWPSRKIKKVGHSLKKLQVVIDSVQGAEETFHLSSFYENFNKSSSPVKKSSKTNRLSGVDGPESFSACQKRKPMCSPHILASTSVSSSCSQGSSSSLGYSSCSNKSSQPLQLQSKQEATMEVNQCTKLNRAHRQVELSKTLARPHLLSTGNPNLLKVKAFYGDDKVRLKLQPEWRLVDLNQEIMRRFNISDSKLINLKYLDDDSEWVLLTCDSDLMECVDLYRSAESDKWNSILRATGVISMSIRIRRGWYKEDFTPFVKIFSPSS